MLDIKFIRENPDIVKNACAVKNFPDKNVRYKIYS